MTKITTIWGFWSIFALIAALCTLTVPVMPREMPILPVLLYGGLVGICAWLCWKDMREWRLPDVGTGSLLVLGVLHALYLKAMPLDSLLLAIVLGSGFVASVRWAYGRFRGQEGLGWGDVKFMAAAGAWVGPDLVLWVVIVAALGALCQAGLSGSLRPDRQVAFGPALVASLLMFVLADNLALWGTS